MLITTLKQWCKIAYYTRQKRKQQQQAQKKQADQALSNLFAETRGATMKIGQLMAGMQGDDAFRPLVTSIQPLPLACLRDYLNKQFRSSPFNEIFQSIDESQAAASLGQVHHAILAKTQAEVAIKIRYPDIIKRVNAELKWVSYLPKIGPMKRWHFNTKDYKTTLQRQLKRELDYSVEADTQTRFRQRLSVQGLVIPKIYAELSNDALLVQSWESGCSFDKVCQWSKKDRLQIGRTLLLCLFQSLFVHGEVHSDPHMGNYLFRHDNKANPITVLLDYGSTVFIESSRRLALLKLIDAICAGYEIDPLQYFVTMGFNREKLSHINEQLPDLCKALFQPFSVQRPFLMENWQLSQVLTEILEEKRWWFRAAGPADLILLLRAFYGLVSQLQQLNVALPWWPLLQYTVGDELIQQARELTLIPLTDSIVSQKIKITAQKLCVRVMEKGTVKIALELPAEAALELDTIMPAEIQRDCGIDCRQVSQKLHNQGVKPQVLFEQDKNGKHYQVWLK